MLESFLNHVIHLNNFPAFTRDDSDPSDGRALLLGFVGEERCVLRIVDPFGEVHENAETEASFFQQLRRHLQLWSDVFNKYLWVRCN